MKVRRSLSIDFELFRKTSAATIERPAPAFLHMLTISSAFCSTYSDKVDPSAVDLGCRALTGRVPGPHAYLKSYVRTPSASIAFSHALSKHMRLGLRLICVWLLIRISSLILSAATQARDRIAEIETGTAVFKRRRASAITTYHVNHIAGISPGL
jgi:hypothetical protein